MHEVLYCLIPHCSYCDAGEDSFIIIACDGLWDVCSDQGSVDMVKDIGNAQAMSQKLMQVRAVECRV